jgi:acyl carrier protein
MKNNLENRIKNVMSAVFEIPAIKIGKESSPDNIESWDSLKHMNLVVALEEEFELEFMEDEILDMMNFDLIISILSDKILNN